MSDEVIKEATRLMDELGQKNQSIMGLTPTENGMFDVLLWMLGGGDKPEL